MKKTNQKTEQVSAPEQVSKLQPFPFIEDEDYLLKLTSGNYVVAYWSKGQFYERPRIIKAMNKYSGAGKFGWWWLKKKANKKRIDKEGRK